MATLLEILLFLATATLPGSLRGSTCFDLGLFLGTLSDTVRAGQNMGPLARETTRHRGLGHELTGFCSPAVAGKSIESTKHDQRLVVHCFRQRQFWRLFKADLSHYMLICQGTHVFYSWGGRSKVPPAVNFRTHCGNCSFDLLWWQHSRFCSCAYVQLCTQGKVRQGHAIALGVTRVGYTSSTFTSLMRGPWKIATKCLPIHVVV